MMKASGYLASESDRFMPRAPQTVGADLQAEGVVLAVDIRSRELKVEVQGILLEFYVPPDCTVLLHDEQVKLRLLQPRDPVRIDYSSSSDTLVVHRLQVP